MFSEKTMEEDEGLRTVECLRGRLLAERASSKAANDESDQIALKVLFLILIMCLCECLDIKI